MLKRKIEKQIKEHLQSGSNRVLLVDGARQVGKTTTIRYICKSLFKENYIEVNLFEDARKDRLFADVKTVDDFFINLSSIFGDVMLRDGKKIIFLDEIQIYPQLLSMLKFLSMQKEYIFIASGSLLGVTLANTSMSPMGSTKFLRMFPMDFEEFLLANNVGYQTIETIKKNYNQLQPLSNALHNKILDLFKKYLLIGGMPQAVKSFVKNSNIMDVRSIHTDIYEYYKNDASQYDKEKNLNIRRIYDLIPSFMENKKKRIIIKEIDNKPGKTYKYYNDDFEYLISAGIAINVQAITNPVFPLLESSKRNLLKLYLNDVGLLTNLLYKNNPLPIFKNESSINLGAVYETVVANELSAHNHNLYYFDSKKVGEVDFVIDDYDNTSPLPIEVKSGRDYIVHRGINNLMSDKFHIKKGIVLSNERHVYVKDKLIYMPIYYVMFL